MRAREEIELVAELIETGMNDTEIARATGLPRRTVFDWRRDGRRPDTRYDRDPVPEELPSVAYAYVLGIYLGDGSIARVRRVWRLKFTLDAAYPGIIGECRRALELLRPENRVHVRKRPESRCVDVSMSWKHWPWLFPQHGHGRKHLREIALADWQEQIVARHHKMFVRGLIHSDGCRYVAHENKNGRDRWSVRYAFANRSSDIKDLFCRSCDALGIRWTVTAKQVSVYRKDSVAVLDTFVGPKV